MSDENIAETIRLHSGILWDAERKAARQAFKSSENEMLKQMQAARLSAIKWEEEAWELLESLADYEDERVTECLQQAAMAWFVFRTAADALSGRFGEYNPNVPELFGRLPSSYCGSLSAAAKRRAASLGGQS